MTSELNRRLARLEACEPPPLRQRFIFLRKAEPHPEPEPGEQLTIIRWIWETDGPTTERSLSDETNPRSLCND